MFVRTDIIIIMQILLFKQKASLYLINQNQNMNK